MNFTDYYRKCEVAKVVFYFLEPTKLTSVIIVNFQYACDFASENYLLKNEVQKLSRILKVAYSQKGFLPWPFPQKMCQITILTFFTIGWKVRDNVFLEEKKKEKTFLTLSHIKVEIKSYIDEAKENLKK